MRRVIIESPYAGRSRWRIVRWAQCWMNTRYALRCVRDSLARNESPIASHLVYTRVLNDDNPAERALGIDAGLAWRSVAEASVVYTDRGISEGMRYGIDAAIKAGLQVEYRTLLVRDDAP